MLSRPTRQAHRRTVTVALTAACLLTSLWPSPTAAARRVVAVGDVHGDLDAFRRILQTARLIDGDDRWSGGRSVLVQTGDLLDRGPDERQVLELMIDLERQAATAGGQVIALLGNHEVMNLYCDLRYVGAEGYATFADEGSERRRQQAYDEYRVNATQFAKRHGSAGPVAREIWFAEHPLGFVERQEAFSPAGKYGAWLRTRSAVVRVGDSVFLHGGLSPTIGSTDVEQIDRRLREEIAINDRYRAYLVERGIIHPTFTSQETTAAVMTELATTRTELVGLEAAARARDSELADDAPEHAHARVLEAYLGRGSWLSVHREGPLWFRGLERWSDAEAAPWVDSLLSAVGARRIVAGHSVQEPASIRMRFDGQVFLIDTGMLASHYDGRPAALEISNEVVSAIYEDASEVLWRPAAPRPTAPRPTAPELQREVKEEPPVTTEPATADEPDEDGPS